MLPVLAAAGTAVKSAAVAGFTSRLSSALGGLFGGAARDRAREQRMQLHLQAALSGDVASARRMLTQILPTTGVIAAERERYTRGWAQLEQQRPDVAAEARRLGELRDNKFGDADAGSWAGEFERLRNGLASELAETVQRMGTGITNAATQAVAPAGTRLDGAVTIPTDQRTLLLAGAGLVALVLFLRRG